MSETAEQDKSTQPGPRRRRRHRRRSSGGPKALAVIALLGVVAVAALSFVFYEIFSSIDF